MRMVGIVEICLGIICLLTAIAVSKMGSVCGLFFQFCKGAGT